MVLLEVEDEILLRTADNSEKYFERSQNQTIRLFPEDVLKGETDSQKRLQGGIEMNVYLIVWDASFSDCFFYFEFYYSGESLLRKEELRDAPELLDSLLESANGS